MKTLIIYDSSYGTVKKACNILKDNLLSNTKILNVKNVKNECLLKYDFIIIGGSIKMGKIQGSIKKFVQNNQKTLLNKNIGLFISCINEDESIKYLKNSYGESLFESAFISSSFGGELDPEKGNIITKKIMKTILKEFENENKPLPQLKKEKIIEFAKKINENFEKLIKNSDENN